MAGEPDGRALHQHLGDRTPRMGRLVGTMRPDPFTTASYASKSSRARVASDVPIWDEVSGWNDGYKSLPAVAPWLQFIVRAIHLPETHHAAC